MAAMREGNFAAAWSVSDRVLTKPFNDNEFGKPRHLQRVWSGKSPAGKHVLVRCYHGLGDTIQFARFLPRLVDVAKSVTTWVQPQLLPLLERQAGFGEFIPLHDGEPEVAFDVDIEIMELAHAFRVDPSELGEVPYLGIGAFPERSRHQPQRRRGREELHLGIVWRVGAWDHERSIPEALLDVLAAVDSVQWHVLQQGMSAAQYDVRFGSPPASDDIVLTARRMMELDLVISVDSMPVHLAGALGIPVWVLLQHRADWRWQDVREDSPWYPNVRVFRQQEQGDWRDLLSRVATELCSSYHARNVVRL